MVKVMITYAVDGSIIEHDVDLLEWLRKFDDATSKAAATEIERLRVVADTAIRQSSELIHTIHMMTVSDRIHALQTIIDTLKEAVPTPSFCEVCKHGQFVHGRGVCTLDKNTLDSYEDFLDECAAARQRSLGNL